MYQVSMYPGHNPFAYDFANEEPTPTQLKEQIESMKKTIERLSKVTKMETDKKHLWVLRIPPGEAFSQKDHQEFLQYLPHGHGLIVMPDDYTLEGLGDEELASCGLQRLGTGPGGQSMSDRDLYDLMLTGRRLR